MSIPSSTPRRLILATTGTGGDILPFIRLGLELQRRGRDVLLAVPKFHEALVASHGLPVHPIGSVATHQALLDNPDLWDEHKGIGVVWRGLEPYFGALHALVAQQGGQACTLICHPILAPLADVARTAQDGLRVVCAFLAPGNLCSAYDIRTLGSMPLASWLPLSWRKGLWNLVHRFWVDPAMLPALNRFRASHGLAPVPHFFAHMLSASDASLSLFPTWLADVQPDWPQPFFSGHFPLAPSLNGGRLAPALEDFLAAGSAPIVFTAGTGHQHAARYFADACQALQGTGRRGLFVTPHVAQIPLALPAEIMWIGHAPFSALLPRTAAIVHHGGIGTMAEACRAGIPQLMTPYAYDQFDNGARARALGVAEVILARRLTARRMGESLQRLLSSPAVAKACTVVAARMAADDGDAQLMRQLDAALGEEADRPPLQAAA